MENGHEMKSDLAGYRSHRTRVALSKEQGDGYMRCDN
jgi:hypothetical protein